MFLECGKEKKREEKKGRRLLFFEENIKEAGKFSFKRSKSKQEVKVTQDEETQTTTISAQDFHLRQAFLAALLPFKNTNISIVTKPTSLLATRTR